MQPDISFQTKIDISQFDHKKVSAIWCIFSSPESSTFTESLQGSWQGTKQQQVQRFVKNGHEYLARKIHWDSAQTDNTFKLVFKADSSHFQGSHTHDRHTCTYRTWRGQTSSASNVLTANAAFVIPKNVWVVRIRANKKEDQSLTNVRLYNLDYSTSSDNAHKTLIKRAFYSFDGNERYKYFLVNPSIDGTDNFVYLNLTHVSKTMQADKLDLSFKVDFLARDECLSSLKGVTLSEILLNEVKNSGVNAAIVNLSCMLSPLYIVHTLSNLMIHGVSDFFRQVDQLEKVITKKVKKNLDRSSIDSFAVLNVLLDRVRFYYAYEISKDLMGLLASNTDLGLDGLQYLETLRARGVLYLTAVIDELMATTERIDQGSDLFVEMNIRDKNNMSIFGQNLLAMEVADLAQAYHKLPIPNMLSRNHYQQLLAAVERLKVSYHGFNANLTPFMKKPHDYTTAVLRTIQDDLHELLIALENYTMAWEKFADNLLAVKNEPAQIADAHKRFLSEIEAMFNLNIVGLHKILTEYFKHHFEDPIFANMKTAGKVYKNPSDFMADFNKLLRVK